MSRRNLTFAVGEYYHLYSRGVDKRIIFNSDEDRQRFLRLLFISNGTNSVVYKSIKDIPLQEINRGERLVAIGAYCLMPNHFHILVKEVEEGGIIKFMSKLLTAYSKYFNLKYDRTGALFSSEFKASHLDYDEYLKYIFAYIHLNPLKIMYPQWKDGNLEKRKVKEFLVSYKFSSFNDYIEASSGFSCILEPEEFPKYFEEEGAFEDYIFDWLAFQPPALEGG